MTKHFSHWTDAAADLRIRGEPFVLTTLLEVKGSAPRDMGTKMLVSVDSLFGTIGGGHLEHSVIAKARDLLTQTGDQQHIEQYPLGAKLGQCCGGRVTVLFECFNTLCQHIAVFGAGHVGRALVDILAQLPVKVTWVDSRANEYPTKIAPGVKQLISAEPADEVRDFPTNTYYVVMTHQHPLDYAITEAVLKRQDAAYLGVIGSQTKAKRFQMRLKHKGYSDDSIRNMVCPIGLSAVPGKHPMEVAVSIAGQIIALYHANQIKAAPLTLSSDVKLLQQIQQEQTRQEQSND